MQGVQHPESCVVSISCNSRCFLWEFLRPCARPCPPTSRRSHALPRPVLSPILFPAPLSNPFPSNASTLSSPNHRINHIHSERIRHVLLLLRRYIENSLHSLPGVSGSVSLVLSRATISLSPTSPFCTPEEVARKITNLGSPAVLSPHLTIDTKYSNKNARGIPAAPEVSPQNSKRGSCFETFAWRHFSRCLCCCQSWWGNGGRGWCK